MDHRYLWLEQQLGGGPNDLIHLYEPWKNLEKPNSEHYEGRLLKALTEGKARQKLTLGHAQRQNLEHRCHMKQEE